MRALVVLGAVLLSLALSAGAAPTDDQPCDTAPAVAYRKETTDTVQRDSSVENDTTKTKTKKDSFSDQYNQTNHTLTEGGVEDSSCLTQDQQHEVKEVDTVKKKEREVIITDKYGNVVSDTKKEKVKEKTKMKEKDKATESFVHTVQQAPPPAPAPACDDAPPAPAPVC